jgi:hypothetical protein
MGSPFNFVNDPTRWRDINREFPFGAHELWVAQRLFAIAVLHVNDGFLDLDLRNRPSLSLKGRPTAANRYLTITSRNIVRKSLRVQFDETGVLIGENYVILNDEGGVMRLVNALVDEAERVWNSQGR